MTHLLYVYNIYIYYQHTLVSNCTKLCLLLVFHLLLRTLCTLCTQEYIAASLETVTIYDDFQSEVDEPVIAIMIYAISVTVPYDAV